MQMRTAAPFQRHGVANVKLQGAKPAVPSNLKQTTAKDKEKNKTFSSAYTGDDDINDVAAMGGVNLAEETQKILGSTEFVGTQIRSCKEDILCSVVPLQQRIRQVMHKRGLDEPSPDVSSCISLAVQERLKNLLEKLAVITEHRLENIKIDQRYEITNDVKGECFLKFFLTILVLILHFNFFWCILYEGYFIGKVISYMFLKKYMSFKQLIYCHEFELFTLGFRRKIT